MFVFFPKTNWSNVFRGLLISVLIIRGRLGILGFSAGGHLATVAATSFEKRPAFQILIYATTDVDAGMGLTRGVAWWLPKPWFTDGEIIFSSYEGNPVLTFMGNPVKGCLGRAQAVIFFCG